MKTHETEHELKAHRADQELEKLFRGYVDDFLTSNSAARRLDELLRMAGIGLRPIIDHLTFRTHNIDRRAEEFVRYGFGHTETLEYNNWFAKVYRREGYPALFIDQAFPMPRGEGSIIPQWVDKFGDDHLHHFAILVDDIEKAMIAMKEQGIEFAGEVVGRHSGPLRQIFTKAETRDDEPFTVLELTERHFGFKGFSPPQAQGLMQSTAMHKKAA
jgi:catechol 2,3-dioxygenase-like lactoylglutathione lyase family enzyme